MLGDLELFAKEFGDGEEELDDEELLAEEGGLVLAVVVPLPAENLALKGGAERGELGLEMAQREARGIVGPDQLDQLPEVVNTLRREDLLR